MRLILLAITCCGLLVAADDPEAAIRAVLNEQMRAWNAGDLEQFVQTYAPDTVFVGKDITRGSAGVLERYRRNYSNREKMGTFAFSDVEVRMLGPDYASVIGRYHLMRTAAGGGDARGAFTLLLKRSGQNWRIVLDHSS